jgi:hypothetical protein
MALAYTLAIFASSADHLHFNDAGTFSLRAPFVMVLLRSSFRLLWFWGFLALAVIFYLRPRGMMLILAIAGTWIVITSLPYSFLTYMPRVPSRHTYMAGVGPALLVAVAVLAMHQSAQYSKRFIPALVCLIILGQNCGYLWTKKLQQYRARAEPTLQLIEFARKTPASRIFVRCFPYSIWIAHYALELELKKEAVEVKEEAEGLSPVFCYRGIM